MEYLCVQRDTVIRRKEVISWEGHERKVCNEVESGLSNI
jgi:hypothetical protein